MRNISHVALWLMFIWSNAILSLVISNPIQKPLLQANTVSSSLDTHQNNVTISQLLAQLDAFASEAFDIDYDSLGLDLSRDNVTYLGLFSKISDQIDHLEAGAEHITGSEPVVDENDIANAQEAVLAWESQIGWEAEDIASFAPKVAKKLDLIEISVFFVNKMEKAVDVYSAILLKLVPEDNSGSLEAARISAMAAIVSLKESYKRLD